MTSPTRTTVPNEPSAAPASPRHRGMRQPGAILLCGSLAVLVARDGSPGWIAVRLVIVLGLGALVLRAARGATAYAAGLVGVSAGAGIGVWALVKSGSWIAAIAGTAALVAGLLLLGGGLRDLVGRVRSWRRPVLAAGLVVLALVVAYAAVPAIMITNVPRPALTAAAPAGFGEVTFAAADGVRLSGWYAPSRNGAAVVVLHGASSTRAAVHGQAEVLRRHGYGVLAYDARGHGRSGGRGMDWGWYGDRDVTGAVAFLQQRPEVDAARIGALGESMGGEQAVGALPAVAGLRAVVAEGTVFRSARDFAWLSEEFGLRGWLQRGIEQLGTSVADTLTAAVPPRSLRSAVTSGKPVLVIAAGSVESEPLAGRWIKAGAPSSVQLWVVRGSPHTGGLATRPGEWESRVVGFFDRTLA